MNKFLRWLFPKDTRGFIGKRWINISLRTLHIIGVAGMGGGYLYQAPAQDWRPYMILTLATGIVMLTIEIFSNAIFLVQVRGIAVMVKTALFIFIPWAGQAQLEILILVLVISGIISHAPANIRYYSLYHRRMI